jgi:hypothetical protein
LRVEGSDLGWRERVRQAPSFVLYGVAADAVDAIEPLKVLMPSR